jgi:hypothetical protein
MGERGEVFGVASIGLRSGLALGASLFVAGCSLADSGRDGRGDVGTTSSGLRDASLAQDAEGRFVVSLGSCSGVLLSPFAIATAAHCVRDGADEFVTTVLAGGRRECVSGQASDGTCRRCGSESTVITMPTWRC